VNALTCTSEVVFKHELFQPASMDAFELEYDFVHGGIKAIRGKRVQMQGEGRGGRTRKDGGGSFIICKICDRVLKIYKLFNGAPPSAWR